MSPQGQNPGQRIKPSNNLYTAILTVASLTVLATVVYVLYMCYMQYGTVLPPQ